MLDMYPNPIHRRKKTLLTQFKVVLIILLKNKYMSIKVALSTKSVEGKRSEVKMKWQTRYFEYL